MARRFSLAVETNPSAPASQTQGTQPLSAFLVRNSPEEPTTAQDSLPSDESQPVRSSSLPNLDNLSNSSHARRFSICDLNTIENATKNYVSNAKFGSTGNSPTQRNPFMSLHSSSPESEQEVDPTSIPQNIGQENSDSDGNNVVGAGADSMIGGIGPFSIKKSRLNSGCAKNHHRRNSTAIKFEFPRNMDTNHNNNNSSMITSD